MSKKEMSEESRLMAKTLIESLNLNETPEVTASASKVTVNTYTPEYILDKLKDKVVGNDELLYKLSSIASMYTMCLKQRIEGGLGQEYLPKLSMFISGQTGTGKTYSVQTLAEILNIPYLRIDCSAVVPHGADGQNISKRLMKWKSYTSRPAYGGIIFLDELDKTSYMGAANNTEWKKNIQSSLLDLIDGTVEGDRDMFNNLLIIGSGSFQCHRNDKQENNNGAIGFHQADALEIHKSVEQHRELLVAGGLIPELAGRFLDIVETAPLTKEQIRSLLFNANSAYAKYCALNHNVFFLEESDVEDIIVQVQKSKVGMREIDGLVFSYFCAIINKHSKRCIKK